MAFDATVSIAVLSVYMLVVLGLGLAAWRLNPPETVEDYLLANRGISWFVGFFSTAASQYSALIFLGFVGFYFNFGLAAFMAILGAYVYITGSTYYFLGPRIWKIGRKRGHITPSDTVRDYYDSPLLGYVVAIGLILALIPYLQVQFTGVGIVLSLATGGQVPIVVGAAIVAAIIGVYTWFGGMRSVAWVDTLQGVMLLGGTAIGGIVLVFVVGGGYEAAYGELLANYSGLLAIPGPRGVFTWPYIMTFGIAVFLGWIFHPHMWMRLHYFKSGRAVENLPWFMGLTNWLGNLGTWSVVLAGVLLIPQAAPDQFILLMYREFFPTVVFALIAAAALAAMMSSASSQCHGIGAVVSRDLSSKLRPRWNDDRHVIVARLATVVAIVGAFGLSTLGIEFLLTSGAAAAALGASLVFPQVTAAVYGWEWPTTEAAIAGSVLGGLTTLVLLTVPGIESPLGLYGGFWGVALNVAVFVIGSYVTDSTPTRATTEAWSAAVDESTTALDREHRRRDEFPAD